MYSPAVVESRLQAVLKSPLGAVVDGRVERVDVSTCRHMTKVLSAAMDPKKGLTRQLTADEQWFVRNERLLTKIDYRYWAERYATILRPDVGVSPMYPLWESQTLILAALAVEEEKHYARNHPDGLVFNVLKGRQLGCCLEGSARVLTADLRWVTLDTLCVGTEIVAVEEEPARSARGVARKMRTGVVEAKAEVFEDAFELVFASGTSIVSSGNHRWLYKTRTQSTCGWRSVDAMRVGGQIRRITEPWGSSCLEDYWMGGMLDGEGSCNAKSSGGAEVCVAQRPGPVFERLRAYFAAHNYAVKEDQDAAVRRSKFGRTPVPRFSLSRMSEIFRLLGQTRPTRFIGRRWWEGKELPGKRNGGYGWERLVAIRPLGKRRLVDLQTSTKTFVAEGLVSHNSSLCQSIVAHRGTTQSYTNAMIASDAPENSGSSGLFGMLERTVEHLPWFLRPAERFHTKDRHIVWANHSSVVVEAGKSMKGGLQDKGGQKGQIGRGRTYSVVHLSELSTWEYADTIDDSLDPAIARTSRTFWAKESTAKGRHNWWHNEWEATEKGYGRSFNVFIPWYAERTKYWLPPPDAWQPPGYCLEYATRVERAAPRWMRRQFALSKEQLYWYYSMREAAEQKGVLYKFLEEYPAEPAEAFQYSGRSIFTPAQIDALRNAARPLRVLYAVQPASLITELRDQAFQQHQVEREIAERKQGPIVVNRRRLPEAAPSAAPETVVAEPSAEVLR